MRYVILCLCGDVLVTAIKSFHLDDQYLGNLRTEGSALVEPSVALADASVLADAMRHHPVLLHDRKGYTTNRLERLEPITGNVLEEEPLWVPWWVPQVSTHFTFFRALMAGLLASFAFGTAACLAGWTPSKFGYKGVFQAIPLWKAEVSSPRSTTSTTPSVPELPETPNVDDLNSELLQRACFAEAIGRKLVSPLLAKARAQKLNASPVPPSDLLSSDDEEEDDPDPPLRPGAEAPFTLLFGNDFADGRAPQESPFALLMADCPRPRLAECTPVGTEGAEKKTTISARKFRHSRDKKEKITQGENTGLPSSSLC